MELIHHMRQRRVYLPALLLGILFARIVCLPIPLFDTPLSFLLLDHQGGLLGGRIAADGQWRFPASGVIPDKYRLAVVHFEDKRFDRHAGVDFPALARATRQNWQQKKVVSGGSTLTMQVVSFYRKRKSKNIPDKLVEILLALRLELSFSKEQLLHLYAANAPFGGNVVGLDAACWRYFQKDKSQLSWAEAATLAVLPNSPSLIHPGRNRSGLLHKRNRLLHSMHHNGVINQMDLDLALAEAIPDQPFPLTDFAPHLLESIRRNADRIDPISNLVVSTIHRDLQIKMNEIAIRYHTQLKENNISNLGILLLDTESGKVLSYVGNVPGLDQRHNGYVDMIQSQRSPGSLLKPFLYLWMLETGELLPNQLVPDIPVYMSGFRPENYNKSFSGAVTAAQALQRSLNIPFALLLKDYGGDRFLRQLRSAYFKHMERPANHYGLSLVLGGVEVTMWEVATAYRLMALAAMGKSGKVVPISTRQSLEKSEMEKIPFNSEAAFITAQTLSHLERPSELGDWKRFESGKKISWKTGTSHGFRDAWAVGMDKKFLAVVWVGNANGEGRPGIVGVQAAAPILFDVLQNAGQSTWFTQPLGPSQSINTCSESGFLAGPHCPSKLQRIPSSAKDFTQCAFHKLIWIDSLSGQRVHAQCNDQHSFQTAWFGLPPIQEAYFRKSNPSYQPLPSWKTDCLNFAELPNPMQWIYPKAGMALTLPRTAEAETGESMVKIAHRELGKKVYWFLNQEWVGTTIEFHQLAIRPYPGSYLLACVDEDGHELKQYIQVTWTD